MKFRAKSACLLVALLIGAWLPQRAQAEDHKASFTDEIRPLLAKYCLSCHADKDPKGELNLIRFNSLAAVRKDLKPWQALIEQLESGQMPPEDKPQPTAAERRRLIEWTRSFLTAEALASAGDPGRVPLHRLSNAEYDYTIRELTRVDLRPTREFPADGAAGEGFTNAAEALAMSPAMMEKYLAAAKDIAAHAVLLPDGFRFSSTKTRRDWTDESLAQLRAFYSQFTADGNLPLAAYLTPLVRQRDELLQGKTTLDAIAAREKLSPKYLATLWQALTEKQNAASYPLSRLRSRFAAATEQDVPAMLGEVSAWRDPLWNFVPIGSYRYGNTVRQVPKDPTFAETHAIKLGLKPAPGQSEVVLYLVAQDLLSIKSTDTIVWQRPRFEAAGQPALLLQDYAEFGPRYEFDYSLLFADTPKYLAAAIEAAGQREPVLDDLAKKHSVDAAWLQRWIEKLAIQPLAAGAKAAEEPGRTVVPVELKLLEEKTAKKEAHPDVNGWQDKGTDLPTIVANASDKVYNIPGRISPHGIAVHPMPAEFVAVAWTSPIAGQVQVTGKVAHAHPACGNGVAWRLELQSPQRAAILADGVVDLGKEAAFAPVTLKVAKGDVLFLAVDARDSNHVCDLTEIAFTITPTKVSDRAWDLAADVAKNIQAGNPHADSRGNKDVWSFVKGPSSARSTPAGSPLADSILIRWRTAAADPERKEEAAKLSQQLAALLTGPRPVDEKHPDRALYDHLMSLDGPLLKGFDPTRLAKQPTKVQFGLDKVLFSEGDLVLPLNKVVELRLPAALLRDREFLVEGKLTAASQQRAVQFQVHTSPPNAAALPDLKAPLVAAPESSARRQILAGCAEFRRLFPPFICYPHVIPLDEVVCLKTFHREDEPLTRLFLNEEQTRRIDRLWEEHRFITKFPTVENEYLPLFIGFVTQDQPKELLDYFESQREPFRQRSEQFEQEFAAAAPQQLQQLCELAGQAYRRPLAEAERQELLGLYATLRKKAASHDDAFRNVLGRVFVSSSFLLHVEQPSPGVKPQPVNDWELASRLSYFLWSSSPDKELRELAAAGRLREPGVLAEQTSRMLRDDRIRALAVEFGTQWIHVRGFDRLNEKSEKLFPTFDQNLRTAINEESILFFQDLFQHDRSLTDVLNADYTFLNDTLAKHYGIPGVEGPQWRRVDGVQQHGRGGILGLASVQAKQSGAARTSPVLRGNWVVETLLGEKLPRPPANVPQLPEEETGNDGLTMRQVVEKHVSVPECAGCHQRIDPFGFALEKYDAIGRLREKDLGGLALDSNVKLKDGTEFAGIEGLRSYLLSQKKEVVQRLFCRRLLGYALGRSVVLSDQPLIDEMLAELKQHDGHLTSAVLTIVRSPQFRMIRGREFTEGE